MHLKYENEQIIEFPILNLRMRLPNVSLPPDLTKTSNLPDGFAYVYTNNYPPYDPSTQKVVPHTTPTFNGQDWVLGYDVVDLDESELSHLMVHYTDQLKQDREQQVNNVIVTTQSGKSFDGNETAQNRMSRAITAMDETDTIQWVLSDNTLATVTREELREALRLAGAAMGQIWVAPYL